MNAELMEKLFGGAKMRMRLLKSLPAAAVAACVAVVALCVPVASQAQQGASSGISERALRAHIKFLADDALEGRAPGSRGGELAAKYIAAQLEALGLRGAGAQGSFFQPVSLVGVKAAPDTLLNVSGATGRESFKFGDDFVGFTGAQTESVSLNEDLVFVGYGVNAPEQKWNDWKGAPEDYKGKILVMLVNDPPATAAEPNLFGGKALTYYGRWTYKYEEAARRGAAGVILLHTDESAGYGWQVVRTSNGSWRFDIARQAGDQTPFLKLRSWMTDAAGRRLLKLAGQDMDELRRRAATREFTPVKLNLKGELSLKSELQRVNSNNVVAILDGRDAQLRDEYVVYTAHWDHFGVGEPNKEGDRIYNGALDNATGCAAVIAVAETLARLPAGQRPRRSVLFLFTTAEEQGLLGAEWYAQHPLVPVAKTAANVNLDSMNILGRALDFAPLGYERSTLRQVVEAVARERGLKVKGDTRPEQGLFFRSDHFPLAKVGIPAVSLKSGNEFVGRPADYGAQQFAAYNAAHYHQPSDEYRESWDLAGMIEEIEIALAIGRKVADAPQMPQYNPGDEFAKSRKP